MRKPSQLSDVTAALVLAALVLGLALALAHTLIGVFDPIERDRRQAEAWRREELADAWQPAELVAGYVWRIAPALAGGVLLVGLAGVTVLMVYRRWTAWEAVRADKLTILTRADRQRFPAGLRSLTYQDRSRRELADAPQGEGATPAIAAPTIPTLADLLSAGRIGPPNALLLGYDDAGQPVAGDWRDLCVAGVGGVSGSGKSTTVTFLLAQAVLYGARILLIDPHRDNPESLSQRLGPLTGRLVCAPAGTPSDIRAALDLVRAELDRRRAGGHAAEPWIVAVDEYSALQREDLAEPLARVAEAIAQEGRKFRIYGLLAGQIWTATRAGGTEVRDALAAAYVHRMRAAQARMLTGLTADRLPRDLPDLPPGTAYLFTPSGAARRVYLPRVDAGDLERVARAAAPAGNAGFPLASAEPAPEANGKPTGSQREANVTLASTASLCPETARAATLFREGHDLAEIVALLTGVDPAKGGRRYQQELARVQEMLREAMRG